MKGLAGKKVKLTDGELLRRAGANRDYLISLSSDNLLLNYRLEAGRPTENYGALPKDIHGGWEFPVCQLRGHFLGHWLSAAALEYARTGDRELLGKAMGIVDELEKCQEDNGGEWVASIPEKFFTWIAKGKNVWAPHYTVHKTFMGLIDMYRFGGYEKALTIADKFADWFVRYSDGFNREEFDDILDFETGGMLEIWCILYEITGKEKYLKLMDKYYRGRLFDKLLAGEDPLTNMHANTTIPEVLGCAKAYEVTGDEKWRKIVEAYWTCAVDKRGTWATGGQTCGEVWTPMRKMNHRLGDKNQEHCTVYNMMRLADVMLRLTGKAEYAAYIEKNLYNGIMAQTYYQGGGSHGQGDNYPTDGLVTYFLPMRPGGRKGWASRTQDFFCCHGTLVQANAILNQYIYYQDADDLYVCQYFDSVTEFETKGVTVKVEQKEDTLSGSFHLSSTSPARQAISPITAQVKEHPDCKMVYFAVSTPEKVAFKMHFRIPDWVAAEAEITINGKPAGIAGQKGEFVVLEREWADGDTIGICLKKALRTIPLLGDEEKVAFAYGPLTLAGLCSEETALVGDASAPESILEHTNEREWGSWKNSFLTKGQEKSIRFLPISEIGYEPYTVYFPVKNKS